MYFTACKPVDRNTECDALCGNREEREGEREREGEWDIRERQREKEGEGHEEDGRIQKTTEVKERGDETGEDERWKTGEQRERRTIKTEL